MSSATEKLLRLADEAERTAAAYRMAAAALNGHAVDKRVTRSAAVLGDALDARRRAPRDANRNANKRTGETRAHGARAPRPHGRISGSLRETRPVTAAAMERGRQGAGWDRAAPQCRVYQGRRRQVSAHGPGVHGRR